MFWEKTDDADGEESGGDQSDHRPRPVSETGRLVDRPTPWRLRHGDPGEVDPKTIRRPDNKDNE